MARHRLEQPGPTPAMYRLDRGLSWETRCEHPAPGTVVRTAPVKHRADAEPSLDDASPELRELIVERMSGHVNAPCVLEPALTGADLWLANNPDHPHAIAERAERDRVERIRRAHGPKRFLVRKLRTTGSWVVRDQAHPFWIASRLTLKGAIDMLNVLGRHGALGEWDGIVRVTLAGPATDEADEYDDEWED